MSKKSEVTNLEILQAINNFAGEVEQYFVGIDKRFKGTDQHFVGMSQHFDRVEDRLDSLEYNQEEILSRLSNLVHRSQFVDLERRVEALESK